MSLIEYRAFTAKLRVIFYSFLMYILFELIKFTQFPQTRILYQSCGCCARIGRAKKKSMYSYLKWAYTYLYYCAKIVVNFKLHLMAFCIQELFHGCKHLSEFILFVCTHFYFILPTILFSDNAVMLS